MQPKTALQASLVQEFVGVAHGDLNRVQELLGQEPGLIHACWDWGGGDFESALGAAAHMAGKILQISFSKKAPGSTYSPQPCLAS